MVLSHLNMEILSQAEESALGKKKIHFAFQMSKDFQNYESKQIRVEDSQIIT